MILSIVGAFLIGLAFGCWVAWVYFRRSYDGFINVEETEDRKVFSLTLLREPETLEDKELVVFKVYNSE